jgi:hypothetical protein
MENATQPVKQGKRRRGGGKKTTRRVIHEDRVIKAAVPAGSRFKGYEDFVVQDLVLRPHVIRYRRERWLTPEGETITAALPAGVAGHFGAELRRFVLTQYHQGQVTVARLLVQLRAIGVDVSKRQVMRLLIADQDAFIAEARDVLRAGHTDYVINAEALTYMRGQALAGPILARLAEQTDRHFADDAAGRRICTGLASVRARHAPAPRWRRSRIPCGLPPRARCGAAFAPTASCLRQSSSATMPASSMSAGTPYAGFTPTPGSKSPGAGAQTRHLHRPASDRADPHSRADLVVLQRSQGLSRRSHIASQDRIARSL